MADRFSRGGRASRFLPLAAGIVLATCVSTVKATTVQALTDEHLVARSQNIFEGTVTRLASTWNAAHTQIHTVVEVRVLRTFKGGLQPGQRISLRMLGGTVGNITLLIVDAPHFRVNEQVLLFLKPDFKNQLNPIVGFNQGKLSVAPDSRTKKLLVQPRQVSRDQFVAKVSKIVKAQTPKEVTRDNK